MNPALSKDGFPIRCEVAHGPRNGRRGPLSARALRSILLSDPTKHRLESDRNNGEEQNDPRQCRQHGSNNENEY